MTTIKLSTSKRDVKIGLRGPGSATINWGDGKSDAESIMSQDRWFTHTYSSGSEKTITITGENITYLRCRENELTSLSISGDDNLKLLSCSLNKLTELDVSGFENLNTLRCRDNKIANLYVSDCVALERLSCASNKLTELDLSGCNSLTYLSYAGNPMSAQAIGEMFASWPMQDNSVVQLLNNYHNTTGGNPGDPPIIASTPDTPIPQPKDDNERRQQIIDGLSLGDWDPKKVLLSNYYSETDKDKPVPFLKTETGLYAATVVQKPINNEEIFIIGNGYGNVIYPGAILKVDTDLAEGKGGGLMNVKRTPIDLFGDYVTGQRTDKKNVPATNDEVRNKIGEMVREYFQHNNWEAPQQAKIQSTYHSSKKTMALEFETDLSFAGNKVSLDFKCDSDEQSVIESFNCKQKFFTVRLGNIWQQGFDTLFSQDETWENIRKRSDRKPLCLVTSVTYGRDLHFVKEYLSKTWNLKANQSFDVIGQTGSSSQKITQTSEAKNHGTIAVGSSSGVVLGGLKADSSRETIENALAENIKFSQTNQGDIIGYELLLLSGKNAGKTIAPVYQGYVWNTEYKRCPNIVQVKVKCEAYTLPPQENVKVRLDAWVITLQGDKIVKREEKMLMEKRYKGESSTYLTSQIQLGANQYIDGLVTLSIRGKATSVSKWWQGDIGQIDASSGLVQLWIKGTTRAGAGKLYLAGESPTKFVVS